MEREHRAFGFPFPETPVRMEMCAEQLQIVHRLWTEPRVDFHGTHETWLDRYRRRSLGGSVEEVAARLAEYEEAGCERVMLQHLLHADLEAVRLVGRALQPALA